MANLHTEWVELQVADGSRMRAWTARPKNAVPERGLLVFQEAFGVNAHIRDVTERWAAQGFVAIAPEIYHRAGPGIEMQYDEFPKAMPLIKALKTEALVHDIEAAGAWLRDVAGVPGDRLASVGYCMGGRLSFLANTVLPLKAAVSYYGGHIPGLLDRVDQLSAPMLFFWGEKDTHIPLTQIRQTLDTMTAAGKTFANVSFSGAGHAFFCDVRASFHAESAQQSWEWALSFLHRHLG
jgi:carboxymethylenebutenolidase